MQDNFGKKDKACADAVKKVYLELGMEARYRQYEDEMYRRLVGAIKSQDFLPQALFLQPLEKMYRRYK